MSNHKPKSRGFRIDAQLDAQWEAFLESSGMTHTQALKQAVSAYLNHYYPKDKSK